MAQQKHVEQNSFPISEYVLAGDFLFISGTLSPTDKSFEEEARETMKLIENRLQANSLTFNDLVSVTVYLKTMDNYAAFNQVYATYFNTKFPSRTCIAVLDLPLKARVEISAIAKKNK